MTVNQDTIEFRADRSTRTIGELSGQAFSDTLRAAIRSRGLTLDRIQWHLAVRGLKVGLSSLSDWQHGRSVPASSKSLCAVRAMEEILDLGTGALSTPLSEARFRPSGLGPTTEPAPERGLREDHHPVGDLLRALPNTREGFDMLARSCKVVVDGDRRASVMRDHTAIRSRRSGADRYVMRYVGDPGCDIEQVRFGRLDNCRLGRVIRHTTEPILVAELLFDHPLSMGESWVFDTEMIDETGECCTEMGHGFTQAVDQFDLEVEFAPGVRPVDCHGFVEIGLDTGRQRTQDLRLSDHRSVHVVASDVRSGVIGIGWSWPDEPVGP
jgi:hypothetical protein